MGLTIFAFMSALTSISLMFVSSPSKSHLDATEAVKIQTVAAQAINCLVCAAGWIAVQKRSRLMLLAYTVVTLLLIFLIVSGLLRTPVELIMLMGNLAGVALAILMREYLSMRTFIV